MNLYFCFFWELPTIRVPEINLFPMIFSRIFETETFILIEIKLTQFDCATFQLPRWNVTFTCHGCMTTTKICRRSISAVTDSNNFFSFSLLNQLQHQLQPCRAYLFAVNCTPISFQWPIIERLKVHDILERWAMTHTEKYNPLHWHSWLRIRLSDCRFTLRSGLMNYIQLNTCAVHSDILHAKPMQFHLLPIITTFTMNSFLFIFFFF